MSPDLQILIIVVILVTIYEFGGIILDAALSIMLAIVLLPFEAIRFVIAKINGIEYHQMGLREIDTTVEEKSEGSTQEEPDDYPPHKFSDYGNS